MPKPVRILQLLGIAIVIASGFFTTMRYAEHPRLGRLEKTFYEISVGTYVGGMEQVPARVLGPAVAAALGLPPRFEPLWLKRAWYPFLLAPIWLLALLLTWTGARSRLRGPVGLVLFALSLGLAIFEAVYLHSDYVSFLPPPLGVLEGILAWTVIVAMLVWRRRRDRSWSVVEATIAAQALLCIAHLLTLPMTMARPWIGGYAFDKVLAAVFTNFPPAFWLACGGLLLVALPVYLRRARSA